MIYWMLMLEEYIVEGVNFVAIVPVDTELCSSPYMEAVTIALEYAIRPERKRSEGFKFLAKPHISPKFGPHLFVWPNGDIGNDNKMQAIKFVEAAKNAGLAAPYVRWLESI